MPLSTLKIQFYKIAFFNQKSSSLKILHKYKNRIKLEFHHRVHLHEIDKTFLILFMLQGTNIYVILAGNSKFLNFGLLKPIISAKYK